MANQELAATTTANGGAAPEGGAFPPFDSSYFSSTLIWLALTFGLLFLLMSRVALPRVEGILGDRRKKIDDDLNAARLAKQQADAAFAAHAKALADARSNAQLLAQQARDAQNVQNEAKRAELEKNLGAKLASAEAKIAQTKTAAMANVGAIAHETASAIFEKLTGQAADADALHAALAAKQS
ncbi:MAG: F0F1 ATP synthase subunit B' [Hyphomicrobiales bacterium]|nr:F0F1 ATP synthase subunit B' [Hyphomicrobiales bacterium]MDE2114590.1 F0F1 ATP synthase subunit B' [Hyphomicrobiales bacterium]